MPSQPSPGVADTLKGNGNPPGALAANQTKTWSVAGLHGVPLDAVAVMLNVTGVRPTASGNLRIFAPPTVPPSSTLNFKPGQIVPNAAVVALPSAAGPIGNRYRFSVFNHSSGSLGVVADLSGYFLVPG